MARRFNGVVNVDVRDSVPDWSAFRQPPAPEGAPNVLLVLYDDTGLAAWSPYGGRINMPTMDRIAANGLTYTQWHTTALCSPTRSCLLTGRNHHENGFAQIAEGTQGFPGHTGIIPMENATLAEVLRENGYSTLWVGKNHNVPIDEWSPGGSKRNWPLARGFDRFYGFIGGETNNWYPNLVEDNHYIEQPYLPEDGYHLSKDLADHAISYLGDVRQADPDKPWFLWFCPGANHAPHHAPQEYIDKYKGVFDDGYEAYREWALARMVERDILPADTTLSPINPLPDDVSADSDFVRPWDSLNDDEKRLFSRMAEVYAGFSEYTDAQVGRVVDFLEQTGQLENTIILYCADNGASGEGSPDGTVNENKFFNAYPEDLEQNLSMIDQLGSPETYNHYPTGWATAFSAPFKMFKRYTYQGGVADPMVISWPRGIDAHGEVRHQYHHAVDVVPTILECIGLEFPDFVQGYEQSPLPGVSMKYTFGTKPDAPTEKKIQYYEMLATRGLWRDGWKVVAQRAPFLGKGHFESDTWELYHTDVDRSEMHDLAAEHPELVKELVNLWYVEAGKYNVLPLDDRTVAELVAVVPVADIPKDGIYRYYPGTGELPEFNAAEIRGRSFKILADVTITDPDAEGVILAVGSRHGGHSLFLKNKKLWYVNNFIGIPPEQQLVSPDDVTPGVHVLGAEFVKDRMGDKHEAIGKAVLHIDDQPVAETPWKTQPGHFSLDGEGLAIGRDTADPVSKEYDSGYPFRGGTITEVRIAVGDDAYIDLERDFRAGLSRD
ncbi:arylsulfatase [Leifsonia poae]|uniref:arylsulfatase n=1 Tax=Leifsonia poae TaxID=110933 RepID=UPI003D671094